MLQTINTNHELYLLLRFIDPLTCSTWPHCWQQVSRCRIVNSPREWSRLRLSEQEALTLEIEMSPRKINRHLPFHGHALRRKKFQLLTHLLTGWISQRRRRRGGGRVVSNREWLWSA